jgi:phosphatidylglycerol:prolipoprotein diacylglycerol transferase
MPQGFNIGPLTIRFYAILIIIGAIAGAWLAARQAKKHGEDSEIIIDMLPWLLIAGIIGARIWHVFTPSASNIAQGVTTENYLRNPIEILKMWNGGLGIPGGVIGGALALIIYTKAKKLNFWQWADFIAPGLLIGQAVGRWGNFINQEVYGRPSSLPWAITIDPRYRIAGFEHVEKYHPLFLYESLATLSGALILLWIDRKYRDKLYKGDIFFGYLIWYSTARFFLEFLRLDPSPVNGINVNQTSMLIVGVLALIILILRHTIWSDRLAHKEHTDREQKLIHDGSKIILDEDILHEGDGPAVMEIGVEEELAETEEKILPILDDKEIPDETERLIELDDDFLVESLPEETRDWPEEHLPDLDDKEQPEIRDEYFEEKPKDDDEQ